MDMGGSSSMADSHACQISMLWNWYTVDACFISTQWHVHSKVAFAFTVICVFILVALVEGVRRLGREYDRRLVRQAQSHGTPLLPGLNTSSGKSDDSASARREFIPTWTQQAIRASIFGIQFGAAYILMLLAMYYNGYIIFAIIFGGTAGHLIFARDTVVGMTSEGEKGASCC